MSNSTTPQRSIDQKVLKQLEALDRLNFILKKMEEDDRIQDEFMDRVFKDHKKKPEEINEIEGISHIVNYALRAENDGFLNEYIDNSPSLKVEYELPAFISNMHMYESKKLMKELDSPQFGDSIANHFGAEPFPRTLPSAYSPGSIRQNIEKISSLGKTTVGKKMLSTVALCTAGALGSQIGQFGYSFASDAIESSDVGSQIPSIMLKVAMGAATGSIITMVAVPLVAKIATKTGLTQKISERLQSATSGRFKKASFLSRAMEKHPIATRVIVSGVIGGAIAFITNEPEMIGHVNKLVDAFQQIAPEPIDFAKSIIEDVSDFASTHTSSMTDSVSSDLGLSGDNPLDLDVMEFDSTEPQTETFDNVTSDTSLSEPRTEYPANSNSPSQDLTDKVSPTEAPSSDMTPSHSIEAMFTEIHGKDLTSDVSKLIDGAGFEFENPQDKNRMIRAYIEQVKIMNPEMDVSRVQIGQTFAAPKVSSVQDLIEIVNQTENTGNLDHVLKTGIPSDFEYQTNSMQDYKLDDICNNSSHEPICTETGINPDTTYTKEVLEIDKGDIRSELSSLYDAENHRKQFAISQVLNSINSDTGKMDLESMGAFGKDIVDKLGEERVAQIIAENTSTSQLEIQPLVEALGDNFSEDIRKELHQAISMTHGTDLTHSEKSMGIRSLADNITENGGEYNPDELSISAQLIVDAIGEEKVYSIIEEVKPEEEVFMNSLRSELSLVEQNNWNKAPDQSIQSSEPTKPSQRMKM
ncbi:hypothetical protein [Vibrio sp. D431a]|uniref:hypothetical protein n=1 Tax=Vibrio sp. D431a TaxID=2837388 RepID=UPI00255313ED|nr:hypothetical protein [Vibrio sp. D431a]MDK9790167.1 hypothetical protein [Vibrio sp. D431a]